MLFSRTIVLISLSVFIIAGGFWGIKEAWNFFAKRPSKQYYGEEALVQRGFMPLGHWGKRDTNKRKVSREPILIDSETVIIRDTDFFQKGDIIVRGTGKLVFENSVLEMTPGYEPRANIYIHDNAELIFEESTLKPHADDPVNLTIHLTDEAKFVFSESLGIHMLVAGGNSEIRMNNSTWAYSMPGFRGGGVRLNGSAKAYITDSTVGGLIVELPPEAKATIHGFKSEKFERFDLRESFGLEGSKIDIILENTQILDDYLEGGNERGLSIFAPSNIAQLKITDSVLNKLVIESTDKDLSFANLKIDVPTDFTYGNINVTNSIVMAQWGFFMHGGRGEFTDSEGLWFFIHDLAELSLKNSEMNEFDPRNFKGVINLEESIWKNAGEIIGNNDFTWRGSWFAQGFDRTIFTPLIWRESIVTREFPVDVFLLNPEALHARGALIEVFDSENNEIEKSYTDVNGRAYFSVTFHDSNFKNKFHIKVSKFGKEVKHDINFLTPTPIVLILK